MFSAIFIDRLVFSFQVRPRLPEKDNVLIIGNEPPLCNWPVVNFVRTLEDLNDVKRQFLTRPLILLVECGKHVPIGQRWDITK